MIRLEPMSEAEYRVYLEKLILEYAAEKVRAGNWTEAESLERSRLETEGLLPQGVQTPGNFIHKLLNENGETVGILWYARREKPPETIFIYDFEIHESFRRRGYASQALLALEQQVRPQGIKKLELHVFGSNVAARELYKKSGFIETNVQMAKEI